MICKILGLFLNTSTADEKYSVLDRDNLTQPIQKQLSKQKKTYSELFPAFSKSRSKFDHFEKKGDPRSLCFSDIKDCERRC